MTHAAQRKFFHQGSRLHQYRFTVAIDAGWDFALSIFKVIRLIRMKNTIGVVLLALCSISVVQAALLTVNPASTSLPAASGRANFTVSNTGGGTMQYAASISAGSDWLSIITGASGGNSGVIRVLLAENKGILRTGQITVMASGANGSPTVVTITQAGTAGSPTPTPTPRPSTGGALIIADPPWPYPTPPRLGDYSTGRC